MPTKRRTFLKTIGAAAAGAAIVGSPASNALSIPDATFASQTPPVPAMEELVEGVSESVRRYLLNGINYEQDNEFFSVFERSPAIGLGYEEGITRRDPSDVIKVGDLYYVWYTRTQKGPSPVGIAEALANPSLRAFSWDLAEVWYATSPDGHNWTERGVAVHRGPEGAYDARTVCTPNILVANGNYYLFYQAAASLLQGERGAGDFAGNVIGMSWAKSPDGPWTRSEAPMLKTGAAGEFDHRFIHDPSLIVRGGKYWLYYKGQPGGPLARGHKPTLLSEALDRQVQIVKAEGAGSGRSARWGIPIAWGVAIADRPEGPYVKSKLNPVVCGGHETIVWPYRKGVCALLWQGPEKLSLQYAEDGLNFVPKAHGLDVPRSAGLFRADKFIDTEIQPGPGVTWGLHHAFHDQWLYLVRFDCDLTLKRGEQIRRNNQELQKWIEQQL